MFLNGQNTFTGAINTNNFQLTIGGSGSLAGGNYAATISSSAFTYSSSANQTLSGNITSPTITKNTSTSSTLTLSGTNTVSGLTTVSAGTLQYAKTTALPSSAASRLNVQSGATLALNVGGTGEFTTANLTTIFTNLAASSSGTNGMNLGSNFGFDTTNASGGTFTIADVIANSTGTSGGARGLTKLGSNTLSLSNTNSYGGATNVNAGTLAVTGSGSINSTNAINVATTGTLRYNSSTALTVAPTLNGNGVSNRAVLGGSGSINASVTLDNLGDVLSPGNSPGTQNFDVAQNWSSFSYDWEVNNFTGTTAGTHFDQIGMSNTLTLSGGSGSYILNVLGLTSINDAGLTPNFSEINRSWIILTTTNGITSFNDANWAINTAGFSSPDAGTWGLTQSGNNLVLNYTAIPEPGAALLGGLGMLALLRRRR